MKEIKIKDFLNINGLSFVYPNGSYKAVTMRFDDGPTTDRLMVSLLNKHAMKATFYLIAGRLDQAGHVTAAEVRNLYKCHEIGNHTYSHNDPRCIKMTSDEVKEELQRGKETLESVWDESVVGYAYVCSSYGNIGEQEYKRVLLETGHKYAIMGMENHDFIPYIVDRYIVGQSFRFSDSELLTKAVEYRDNTEEKLSVMFTMAHTYEFDDSTLSYDWNTVSDFFEIISKKDDIWYATNGEVVEYLLSINQLMEEDIYSDRITNTTEQTIYLKTNGDLISLKSGESLDILTLSNLKTKSESGKSEKNKL